MPLMTYWNLVRSQNPNIQVRLQQFEDKSQTNSVGMGYAIWLSCCLEDRTRELRLSGQRFFWSD